MSRPVLRAVAVAGAAALALGAPASAFAATHSRPAKSTVRKAAPVRKPVPVPFTAVGLVTAVDVTAGTVTVADTAGSRDLKGTTVVVTVGATTKVTRDDAPATLADLVPGDAVTANGVRGAGGALPARNVNATSPVPAPVESPAPTDSPVPAV